MVGLVANRHLTSYFFPFICLKRRHFSFPCTSEAPRCRCCSRLPHIQAPRLPVVSEAPAHPSTKVSILLGVPTDLRHQDADGARLSSISGHQGADATRCSRTFDAPRCQCCPTLTHIQYTKVSMLLQVLVHPRYQYARGSRTTNVLGYRWRLKLPHVQATMCRYSCTTNVLGYRWCLRLPRIQAPRCRWCLMLRHDQGPKVSEALVLKREGLG
ncbi:hypothetical protein GOBAR_AA09768 [Gossypium barbadense]|uniref:Uncharacterized protein n=1 Tax=Gossypium barbadense TaxID=3634 RepID=A0A2P5Y5K4_GOSBA|nr:hypothetical protein GOBAR_AA09768 [Gossypium barbadense]